MTAAHVAGAAATRALATLHAIQTRNPHPGNTRDEASDGPSERVVTGDLDEHREQVEDNRRWRQLP